ncbi:hypothetical protein Tco_0567054 [Tanacetum coccineum]
MMKPAPQQESVQEFTDKLFQTTSSSFSPAPLKEPSPPRDPAKGKGFDIEEPVNEEESEKALKKLLNPATVKAQVLKWKEHEEKKAKLVNEYYECIQGRTDPLPITKISYIINSQKEPTMRITRVFQRESEFRITSTVQLIRLLKHINLDSPEAGEMYKIMEIEIESRDDVNKAKEISLREQHLTYLSQIHCQGSRRLLEDILVSWDGYQLVGNSISPKGATKGDLSCLYQITGFGSHKSINLAFGVYIMVLEIPWEMWPSGFLQVGLSPAQALRYVTSSLDDSSFSNITGSHSLYQIMAMKHQVSK